MVIDSTPVPPVPVPPVPVPITVPLVTPTPVQTPFLLENYPMGKVYNTGYGNQGYNGGKDSGKKLICYNCHKPGHKSNSCRSRRYQPYGKQAKAAPWQNNNRDQDPEVANYQRRPHSGGKVYMFCG